MKPLHRLRRLGGFVALVICMSVHAEAHLVTTGLGPVYDGIGHFLLTPQDLIAVLALCFFAGLRGRQHGRAVLFLLPVAWFLAGTLLGSAFAGFGEFPFSAFSFIILGLLVATDVRMSSAGVGALAVGLGVAHGIDNASALSGTSVSMGLLGIMGAVFVVVSLTTAVVVSLRQDWMRIVVRVAGSWIVATGIMMLGWHYRPPANSPDVKHSGNSVSWTGAIVGHKATAEQVTQIRFDRRSVPSKMSGRKTFWSFHGSHHRPTVFRQLQTRLADGMGIPAGGVVSNSLRDS